jgi:hypothetical protein
VQDSSSDDDKCNNGSGINNTTTMETKQGHTLEEDGTPGEKSNKCTKVHNKVHPLREFGQLENSN